MKKNFLVLLVMLSMTSFSNASDSISLTPIDNEVERSWDHDNWDNDYGDYDDGWHDPSNDWDDDWDNDYDDGRWDDDYDRGRYNPRHPRRRAHCKADLVMGRKVLTSFRAKARGENFRHARRKACRKAMRKCRQGFRGRNVMPSFGVVRCEIHRPGISFGPY